MTIGITTFGCDSGRSGIGRYAVQLLKAMAGLAPAERFEVVVHDDERAVFVPDSAAFSALPAATAPRNPALSVAWHQAALPLLAAARGWDALFLPAGNRRLPLWAPCPLVGTVHDMSSLHVGGKYDAARELYIRRVLPVLYRRLDRVVTVSESTARDLVDHAGVPRERIRVTPLGVDAEAFRPVPPEAAAATARRLGIDGPFVLYVSRIEHPGKNHVRLIRAFDRLKCARPGLPHRLVLAGPDWTRAADVHATAEAAAHARDGRFLGFVDAADLASLYSAAEVVAFPSLFEGFGLPVVEAMACGAPVACSDRSSLPEVAGDAAILFDPDDEAAISSAIGRLLADPGLRADLSRRGLERSRSFRWERTAAATLQAIREACRPERADRPEPRRPGDRR
jgi:glycosyltransferase involved in cell wall biosynthesis